MVKGKGKGKKEEVEKQVAKFEPFSALVKQVVLEAIRSVKVAPENNQWKVLLLDHTSKSLVSSAVKMYDILQEGIDLVENLEIERQPLPKKEAIYIISPTKDSVNQVIEDFDPDENTSGKDQYAAVHLFFTGPLPQKLFEKLTKAQVRLYISTLKEINLLFYLQESQVFHMGVNDSFTRVFSASAQKEAVDGHLRELARTLSTVFTTMGERPFVRFDKKSSLAKRMATMVNEELGILEESGIELRFDRKASRDNRCELLLLDRTVDLLAPLLHEFTYQAMVWDLVKVDKHNCVEHTYTDNAGNEQTKRVLLSEADQLWVRLRHMHIRDTSRWLVKNFNEFVAVNKKAGNLEMGKTSTLKEMGEAMRAMPQYQDMKSKYAVHIELANRCMAYFKKRNLGDLGMIEQDMVVGVKRKDLKKELSAFFNDDHVKDNDKLRLLLLYLISQSDQGRLTHKDKEAMVIDAGYPPDPQGDAKIIRAMGALGVRLDKASLKEGVKEAKEKAKEEKKGKKKKDADNDEASYELSRYVPVIKRVTQSLIQGDLPTSKFPYLEAPVADSVPLKDATSSGSKAKWGSKKQENFDKDAVGTANFKPGRVVVFVIGGATLSETRSAYELTEQNQREVIIGSSCIVTPKDYISLLSDIEVPK